MYILLGAHELWARRTMCKSVFFSKSHKLPPNIWGLFWLKGLGDFGNPAGREEIIENYSEQSYEA
jgi:hypothetical protein